MLGFAFKYIDSQRMVLDDWMSEYEVFEYTVPWEEEEDSFF